MWRTDRTGGRKLELFKTKYCDDVRFWVCRLSKRGTAKKTKNDNQGKTSRANSTKTSKTTRSRNRTRKKRKRREKEEEPEEEKRRIEKEAEKENRTNIKKSCETPHVTPSRLKSAKQKGKRSDDAEETGKEN